MSKEELTGRQRHRVEVVTTGWGYGKETRHLLVLQVERKWLRTWFDGAVQSEWMVGWRDAQVSDLSVMDPPK